MRTEAMKPLDRPMAWLALAALGAACLLAPGGASAQMMEDAWNFKQRDRAGLAVVQKQVDEGMFSRSSGSDEVSATAPPMTSTLLICGGDGGSQSSARANSSCIILNNATGDLTIGQDALGDQSADATSETVSTTTADEVTQILETGQDEGVAAAVQ